jgi:hypothetical protein
MKPKLLRPLRAGSNWPQQCGFCADDLVVGDIHDTGTGFAANIVITDRPPPRCGITDEAIVAVGPQENAPGEDSTAGGC